MAMTIMTMTPQPKKENPKIAPPAAPSRSKPAHDSDRNSQLDPNAKPDFSSDFKGSWALVSKNSGVSGMHIILLPNNKLIMFDASAFHISDIKLPNGQCIPFTDKRSNKQLTDCWAHGVEFDINTSKIRPLKLVYDPWCSSGGLAVDGTLVGTGGWDNGVKTVRYMKPCNSSDGGFVVVGGRRAFSYEYVPPPGKSNNNKAKYFLPLLDQTTDMDENNLYPFVHLSTDGNLFIFANNRSVLLNPKSNSVLRELPVLPGGARNYPASAMSALLPIRLDLNVNGAAQAPPPPAEVLICGGAKHKSYGSAARGTFLPALQDCNRITVTDPVPVWRTENMPSRRVMGDMLILPTGDLLLLNGAKSGTAAWFFADNPNLIPVLYRPDEQVNQRFTELAATDIARMYHSSAAVRPDGKIIVAGSNTNPGYNYTAKYPTELRVEKFSPPYLDPALAKQRPEIAEESPVTELSYGKKFEVVFKLRTGRLSNGDVKLTMYAPPFTTHGYSMNQRMLVLQKDMVVRISRGVHRVVAAAPPSGVVAPPGYYLLFVVHRGVPSKGIWVRIK
ncbi:hypothetical protein TIFTF001_019728 [Ficus carica]|uniref:Galactose oxidase n=1 Tax=Ficus carica TaxID=3494 RepID=A0AA88A754_FICCA|nr:hypothetical protein TIFTF001_019728 [Ficus carica]